MSILTTAALAAPLAGDALPPDLAPWVGWAVPDAAVHSCPRGPTGPLCLWPGRVALDASADGATAHLDLVADQRTWVPLPGGAGTWPLDVRVDGRPGLVRDSAGLPEVQVEPGAHTVDLRFGWTSRPATLGLPEPWVRVDLRVDGAAIAWPQIEGPALVLGAGATTTHAGESVEIEVHRKVADGVPVVLTTSVNLRVSGPARELDLGAVLVPSTHPSWLHADLPARLDADGHLHVQVRPGAHIVTWQSVADGPVTELDAPKAGAPWPATETWVVETAEHIRSVNIEGPPGVDPRRTTLPEDWRQLPAFMMSPGEAMRFTELRRGTVPAPDDLTLNRTLWLDLDGGGATVRDELTGTLGTTWRLATIAPLNLGHTQLGRPGAEPEERLVTVGPDGSTGVEVRERALQLTAESRIEGPPTTLPAVAWNVDVHALSTQVHAGPGWRLLAATGVDRAHGAILDGWTLFDLFFVLITSLAARSLLGWRWALVTLLGVVFARHENGSPQWAWPVLIATAAVVRHTAGTAQRWARVVHGVLLVALVAWSVPWAMAQVRSGLHPALGEPFGNPWATPGLAAFAPVSAETMIMEERGMVGAVGYGGATADAPAENKVQSKSGYGDSWQVAAVDPNAVVQTGPGVPRWTWSTFTLEWNGPVTQTETVRLYWLGPLALGLLAFARVGLLGALTIRLARTALVPLLALGLALGSPAQAAIPPQDLLDQLAQRWTAPPACDPNCAEIAHLDLAIDHDELTLTVVAMAQVPAGVALPGPAATWTPSRLVVDGAASWAMREGPEGVLVRVPAGVHTIVASGPLPNSEALSLTLPLPPHEVSWRANGWTVDGVKLDGTVDRTLQLIRVSSAPEAVGGSQENLVPLVEVEREVQLGLSWQVTTTVRQLGASRQPSTVRVPLLPGEHLIHGDLDVVDGSVSVGLDQERPEASWTSTLEPSETLTWTAPTSGPWETWTLLTSPIWSVHVTAGPPPTETTDGTSSRLRWRPWPGEVVTAQAVRPVGAEGPSTTIDAARLLLSPGTRQVDANLHLEVRSSKGGRLQVALPAGVAVSAIQVDGTDEPVLPRDDGVVAVPIPRGASQVELRWSEAVSPSWIFTTPAVDIGAPAANAEIVIAAPTSRWIVALFGPPWGPVPLIWTWVAAVAAVAPILRRIPGSWLGTGSWILLGLGLTQVPAPLALVVVGWVFLVSWREASVDRPAWQHNAGQLALIGMTLATLVILVAAIHVGLLFEPDFQVQGNGSSSQEFRWTVDRVTGPLPTATAIRLPIFLWRLVHLAWALWLSAKLVSWLPRTWRALASGGWYRGVSSAPAKVSADG